MSQALRLRKHQPLLLTLRHRPSDHQTLVFGEVVDLSKDWSHSYLKGNMWKWTGRDVDKKVIGSEFQE